MKKIMPKILAIYLPQFYETEENNKWWGKGFTEWTSVKKSKPLFEGHYQPKIPLNSEYYTLNQETLERQSNLAKEYGVYGFCFYHYWFQGKLILEKPAEILLKNIQIPMNYCFSWANQTWSRTWYGYEKEVLIEQTYGNKKSWESHFMYLLQFFRDERYIKVEGKPMFCIYQPQDIPCYDDMIDFWEILAIKNGLPGIHIVETLTKSDKMVSIKSSAGFYYEPGYTLNKGNYFTLILKIRAYFLKRISIWNSLNTFDYSKVCKDILSRDIPTTPSRYIGAFVDWDNTARKNKLAFIFLKNSPDMFAKYLKLLVEKATKLNSEFIFITAWNEWAEGAYLEPDQKHKYAYLESIKGVVLNNK
jgi:lipopolysaccharide biosynthesis protein